MPNDRRKSDRRVSERRAESRGGPDRRRGDRRATISLAVLSLIAAAGITPPAVAFPASHVYRLHGSPTLDSLPVPNAASAYRRLIQQAGDQHGVSPALIEAVIQVESGFRPRAVSKKGAQGLMQLMPSTAARFDVTNSFDPEQNILAGTRYLAWLLGLFGGDVQLACAAYNAGEQAVLRFGGVPPYPETQEYVRKIWTLLSKPAGNGADRGAVRRAAAERPAPRRDEVIYLWYDEKGILNVSQFPPPPGTAYKTMRP
jgi:soluble lytic murein transglycosylase-like protein